jgi:hypothetical protein
MNKIFTLASELKELRSKWQTLSIYENAGDCSYRDYRHLAVIPPHTQIHREPSFFFTSLSKQLRLVLIISVLDAFGWANSRIYRKQTTHILGLEQSLALYEERIFLRLTSSPPLVKIN